MESRTHTGPLPPSDLQQPSTVASPSVKTSACPPSKLGTKATSCGSAFVHKDTDIIIINNKNTIKYQGNYILL